MAELNDHELLAEYARTDSEAAFAELVARHVNLVYSAALHFTGNPHHTEEITQAVFIILARKAGSLRPGVVLSGWLYQTARLTAANFVKGEIRRQDREQEAYMQSTSGESEIRAWQQIAPLLDEAMGQLGEADRDAVVLRYFKNKSSLEVAAKLNLTETTARKRLNRALEKLRKYFTKRGVALSATLIAGAVSANSVQAAPAALAKSVTVVAVTKGAAASSATLTLIKGALKIMAWTKAKTAVIAGAVFILTVGTTTVVVKYSRHHTPVKAQLSPADAVTFKQESIKRLNQSKQWALACIMYAADHQDQLPGTLQESKTFVPTLSDANWELVSGGKLRSIVKPSQTILLREKQSQQAPDGKFIRVYAFVDGHSEMVVSPDDDFAALEKQHFWMVQPAKN